MRPLPRWLAGSLLPLAAFTVTVVAHLVWTTAPPAPAAVDSPWASLPSEEASRLSRYVGSGGYWMGYAYGLSVAFAAAALRRFIRGRTAAGGGFALGGVSFSGLLAFFGCYLTGCCGSPILVVYLSVFGAGFLPFAKPFVAVLTTLSVVGAWWWMVRGDRRREACCRGNGCAC